MEFNSYQSTSSFTSSINTGSYFTNTENGLFFNGYTTSSWFGLSKNDVIEIGVWDRNENLLGWNVLNESKSFNSITSSYINSLNLPVTYSYLKLISDLTIYQNTNILINPTENINDITNFTSGSFYLTYNFTREIAGNNEFPLVIKEISPSRSELKLVPLKQFDNSYTAFCEKEVFVQDISSLYIKSLNNIPYDEIYSEMIPEYSDQINTLKSIFFLSTDGAVISFLKTLYEDQFTFTSVPSVSTTGIIGTTSQLNIIQGIRTNFNNYLLSNSDNVLSFNDVDSTFGGFVSSSIENKFLPIGKHPVQQYVETKEFVYDFFTKFYYQLISNELANTYNQQYYSYLKNCLNFGNNNLLPIINTGFIDERNNPNDPLTLLIKLQNPLPNTIMAQNTCWVSNTSMVPIIVGVILKNPSNIQIHTIGPPNFSIPLPNVNQVNSNTSYTANDLSGDEIINRELIVSKNLEALNVDYTNFSNFVVFSCAELRLKIFKNKMINLSNLTASVADLNNKNSQFLLQSGSTYPFYNGEFNEFQSQINNIFSSFDGYESYLYRSGNYIYSGSSFISSSYVSEQDTSASYYDKNNRDSLIHNCPSHILLNSDNDEYIIFLSMIGHFFDNIFIYISNLPSEKISGNNPTEEFTRTMVDHMLETFGWTIDDVLNQTDSINNYLTSDQIEGLSSISSEDRLKTIRNRILSNLPGIYKTKGTEESIRLILACYGIPSTLLTIREYGGVNYSNENAAYTIYERTYMYQWNTSSIYDTFSLPAPSGTSTYLTKLLINDSELYSYNKEQILFGRVSGSSTSSSISGSGEWAIGFNRYPEKNCAQLFFRIGYSGYELFKITSSAFPLFDGNVYSIMLRRNYPDQNFDYSSNIDLVPCFYDLYIQRNKSGIKEVYITSSAACYNTQANQIFDLSISSSIKIGGWFSTLNGQGFVGAMDKWQMWAAPLTNGNFEDYVNHINSYSFTGSFPSQEALLFRMHTDYPFDMNKSGIWRNANSFYAISSSVTQNEIFSTSTAVSIDYLTNNNAWSGSSNIIYDSASCKYISQSAYPYQFTVVDYPSTLPTSFYGPNKFRNEKVLYISQSISTRFDDKTRSTFTPNNSTSQDSNQVGFYNDPQDFKNKDIVRFFGNYNVMDLIGDPSYQYCDEYSTLKTLRYQYSSTKNEYSGSKTLFNELITLYKLYFNNSIFNTIKNLLPARTNALVGIIIEPTLIERPKYKSKPIRTEMNSGSAMSDSTTLLHYFRDPNSKSMRMTQSLEYADFGFQPSLTSQFVTSSLPKNLLIELTASSGNINSVYPINYLEGGTYISDVPDDYQMGQFGTLNPGIQLRYGDISNGEIPFDMNYNIVPSGSSTAYLLKRWKRHTIYEKSSSWHDVNRQDNLLYVTNSIYLYDYVSVNSSFFDSLVYTSSIIDNTPGNPGSEFGLGNQWIHYPNTFRNSPNAITNNYLLTGQFNGIRMVYGPPVIITDNGEYFEIVGGYPRNHFSHKRSFFSLNSILTFGVQNGITISGSYRKNQQTISTTIGQDGLEDGSPPVQIIPISNVNLVQSNNVINN